MSALTSADYPLCAEMFRRTFGVEIGTPDAADAIRMPTDQPNREYWRSQVEWIATSGWAYGLVYSDHSIRRYRDLPDDLRDFGARARLPGRAPEIPTDGATRGADGQWVHPPITDGDNLASE
jgi:hypothetical protein